jgi:lipopolysaccharide export LptBFGC system permease protein LptF
MVPLIETDVLTDTIVPVYVMFAIALPFLVVFGRDTKQLWALIVGAVLALAAISFLIAPDLVEYILPVALILVGIGILVRLITRREGTGTAQDEGSGT